MQGKAFMPFFLAQLPLKSRKIIVEGVKQCNPQYPDSTTNRIAIVPKLAAVAIRPH